LDNFFYKFKKKPNILRIKDIKKLDAAVGALNHNVKSILTKFDPEADEQGIWDKIESGFTKLVGWTFRL
jgi:hypothetical protein